MINLHIWAMLASVAQISVSVIVGMKRFPIIEALFINQLLLTDPGYLLG